MTEEWQETFNKRMKEMNKGVELMYRAITGRCETDEERQLGKKFLMRKFPV